MEDTGFKSTAGGAGEEKVVDLTRNLIVRRSDTDETEVARFIQGYLKSIGIDSEILACNPKTEQERYGVNLVASIGKGEGLMLAGHMDTVALGDETQWKHRQGEVVGDRLYGRGASDMKGGLASILTALSRVDLSNAKRRILLVFDADEEGYFTGANHLVADNRDIFEGVKYGILAETSDLKIKVMQKGLMGMRVVFRGTSAHASTPSDKVDSAIVKAAGFVSEATKLNEKFKDDGVFGKGTLIVGTIKGGTGENVVPNRCEVSVDRRIVTNETLEEAREQILSLVRDPRFGPDPIVLPGFEFKPYKLDMDSKVLKMLTEASGLEPVLGKGYAVSSGYTEAELFSTRAGVESAIYGPGSHEMAHQVGEYVNIGELLTATATFEKVIGRWVSGG